ncbi:MAG: metal-dependent transcriptional regulator [Candidatus Aadella gelida]|nr:metal-dependent transcriptional regulator [Candidatus Aadella gelida]
MSARIKQNKKLSSNMEDYLEAIAYLREKNKVARVKDISDLLQVKASSVSAAIDNLSKRDLVVHERYGYVQLTPVGEKMARDIAGKHKILVKFLTEILSIDPEIAGEDACKMEHSISSQTFEKLTKFMEFIETAPVKDKPEWLKAFNCYLKTGKRRACKIKRTKPKTKT